MKRIFLVLSSFSLAITGCYYDKENLLYNCSVDAANTKYSTTVGNLMTAYGCTGCHGATAPSGNISLATYSGVKAVAANGRLYGAVSHATGYKPMPQGGNKMNDCDLKKLKAWIDAGAPNN